MDIIESDSEVAGNLQERKKFLGIYFACCNVYGRIYNHSGTYYDGKCPICLRRLKIRIGSNGVSGRFLVAS